MLRLRPIPVVVSILTDPNIGFGSDGIVLDRRQCPELLQGETFQVRRFRPSSQLIKQGLQSMTSTLVFLWREAYLIYVAICNSHVCGTLELTDSSVPYPQTGIAIQQ